MPPRVGGGRRGRNGKNGPYKSKDFLQKQKQLRQLLIPFDEEKLSTRAGEALALLRDHPDLLDYSIVQALVEEKVTEKLEEGEADNYGMGFGEAKHRQVTSEWSRWVTFAGDTDTWPGERLKPRAGFTPYLCETRSFPAQCYRTVARRKMRLVSLSSDRTWQSVISVVRICPLRIFVKRTLVSVRRVLCCVVCCVLCIAGVVRWSVQLPDNTLHG